MQTMNKIITLLQNKRKLLTGSSVNANLFDQSLHKSAKRVFFGRLFAT